MRRTIETMTRRAVAALGIGACLASAAGALHAQTWMAAYGDGGIDMGRGGVIALPSDGEAEVRHFAGISLFPPHWRP